jgi:hypothetical protein
VDGFAVFGEAMGVCGLLVYREREVRVRCSTVVDERTPFAVPAYRRRGNGESFAQKKVGTDEVLKQLL